MYGSFWDIPGGDMKIPGGYQNVFRGLYEEIENKVLLNKEVVEINHVNGDKIVVKCRDGSEFRADSVIVTIPLGYLKKHHKTLFKPALPQKKVRIMSKYDKNRLQNSVFPYRSVNEFREKIKRLRE